MKYLPNIAGVLLGLLFVFGFVAFMTGMGADQPMPDLAKQFMAVFVPTGYMMFVKVFELIGGILVAIPRLRNFGLLILGPIILNILAFSVFIMKGEGLVNPMTFMLIALPLYLLWVGRKAFAGLLN